MVEELKKLGERYHKNKEALGFSVNIKKENKKFIINFSNLEKKYEKALSKLVSDLLAKASEYISEEFFIEGLKSDEVEYEALRIQDQYEKYLNKLLDCLLTSDMEIFFKNVSFVSIKYKQMYELANTKIINGKIVDRFGREIC